MQTLSGTPATESKPRAGNAVTRYLARFDDGEVLRWAFRGLVIGTVAVLGLDLRDLAEENGWALSGRPALETTAMPVLPPAVETDAPGSNRPRPEVTADEDALRQPIRFTLEAGGRLSAFGTIDPGASNRLREELELRGEYVKTVTLNSPGGALEDAMAIGRMLRERSIGTEVGAGAICASSCPLAFAGGKSRSAGADAAIGVHQFYAAESQKLLPAQAMSDAQATTARITRYLQEMDVDPALWLHALDTPPQALYYFSADEMAKFRLVTGAKTLARG